MDTEPQIVEPHQDIEFIEDGEDVIMSFSSEFCEKHDWQVGDSIVFDTSDGLKIHNESWNARHGFEKEERAVTGVYYVTLDSAKKPEEK